MAVSSNIESKTQSMERMLSATVEQAAEAVLLTDRKNQIVYVNAAFERATGYAREEVLCKTPRFLRSGGQSDEFYSDLWSHLGHGLAWKGRMVNRRANGQQYTVDSTIFPVRDDNGDVVNYAAIERDVTHEVELEMQLRQAQKLEAVGSLAAGIAHEVNTPIQFIGGNTEFLGNAFEKLISLIDVFQPMIDTLEDEQVRQRLSENLHSQKTACDYEYYKDEIEKAVSQTLEGVKRVSTIVRAMKDFSHPDVGQMSLANINDIITTTLTVARNEYKYLASVELELDPDIPEIDCLRNELHQVFLNLVVNAAHAIEETSGNLEGKKGIIRLTSRSESDSIVVEISDNGCGIKTANQERVFEPFFTTKDVGRGTGQGLALVRSIITERHSGEISFESKQGKGTTFFIRLPRYQQEQRQRIDFNDDSENGKDTGLRC